MASHTLEPQMIAGHCTRHFKAGVCTQILGTLWARWPHRWNQHGCPEGFRLEHLRFQRNLREAFKTHAELLRLPDLELLAVEELPPKLLTTETTR